jgi:hypothetical protein
LLISLITSTLPFRIAFQHYRNITATLPQTLPQKGEKREKRRFFRSPEEGFRSPEVQKTEVQKTEVQKTEVQKTEVQKTEVQKTEVQKTEVQSLQ